MDKDIKYIIEKNINFNPVDYQDEILDLVDRQTISNISYKYFPKTRKLLEKIIIERLIENIECPYLNDINTSEITDMSNLFNSNPDEYLALAGINIVNRLKQLDLSKWITSNVTDMTRMFYMCSSLEELNISYWDTSNVTYMNYMFSHCQSLKELDISNWDTSNVVEMDFMFFNCKSIKKLDLSNWDTSNVTGMNVMFGECETLKELDLSNWDTSNVTGMEFLFDGCIALRKLYLTNFNTKNADLGGIFNQCKSLTDLITNDKRILTVYKRKVKRNKSLQKELNTLLKII